MDTKSLRDYLIRWEELAPDWLILYAATYAIQMLCASLRGGVAYIALWIVFKLAGQPTGYLHAIAFLVAYAPLAASLLTLFVPLTASWPSAETKARYPTGPEQDLYRTAIQQVRQRDPGIRPPRHWYVLNSDEPRATAYADSLLLSTGLLEHEHSTLLLAEALIHLNSSDARLTAALQRITITPRRRAPRGLRTICALAGGTAGMWPLKGAWEAYWRTRDHHAHQHAQKLLTDTAVQTPVASAESARQVAGRSEPVKGTPSGPPTAGPDGLPLTEP